jgi:hypothetical protein
MSFKIEIKNLYIIPSDKTKTPKFLGEKSMQQDQTEKIKIPLKEHQKTSVAHIKNLERNCGYSFIESDDVSEITKVKPEDYESILRGKNIINNFSINHWILSDKTGYGKTLTACASLDEKEDIKNISYNIDDYSNNNGTFLYNNYNNIPYQIRSHTGNNFSFYQLNFELSDDSPSKYLNYFMMNTTLIIVSYGKIFKQWSETLDNSTNYDGIKIINSTKDLHNKIDYYKLGQLQTKFNNLITKYYLNSINNPYKGEYYGTFTFQESSYNVLINNNNFDEIICLFNEFMEYKKEIDNMDYILITNTFAKDLINILSGVSYLIYNILFIYIMNKIFYNYENKIDNSKYINQRIQKQLELLIKENANKLNIIVVIKELVQEIISKQKMSRYSSYYKHYLPKFYRIIIDEVDTINLKGQYSFDLENYYVKLGLITATYKNLLKYNVAPMIDRCINLKDNGIYSLPLVINNEDFLEKSFKLPNIYRNYYICDFNEAYSQIYNNVDYLQRNGYLSEEAKEKLNACDFNGFLKELGAGENSNDNIIDKICKDIIRNLNNKKMERDLISQLDLDENIKNSRLANINKSISEIEEKINELTNKFQDVNIYDKIFKEYGQKFIDKVEDIFFKLDTNIEVNNKKEHLKNVEKEIKELFKSQVNNFEKSPKDNYLFVRLCGMLENPDKYCGICANVYRNPALLGCSHVFCSECLIRWIKDKNGRTIHDSCPLCRTKVDFKKLCLVISEEEKKEEAKNEKEKESKKENEVIEKITDLSKKFKLVSAILDNKKTNTSPSTNLNVNDIPDSKKTKKINKNNTEVFEKKYDTKHDKCDSIVTLLKYINDTNEDKKVIVFSNHTSICHKIVELISNKELNYKAEFVKGQGTENSINRFKTKDSNILFLDSRHNAAGIEIPEGTDIILLHKMSNEIENQIIGRCMRMGRDKHLNVHYVYHNNEEQI